MKYKQNVVIPSLYVPPASGAVVAPTKPNGVVPWLPSTWPSVPHRFDGSFLSILRNILEESMLKEIDNVIADVSNTNGSMDHRGHVLAIALMCALDAVSAYGYRGHHVEKFVQVHFPQAYRPFGEDLYRMYRNSLIHSWNLFAASILPGKENISKTNGVLSFGLLNFHSALREATEDYLQRLATSPALQTNTLKRYEELRKTACP